ncbi:hypothetical protein BJ878DRAFT_560770 [Calycina marina]|uniref:Polyketide synthase n=1 Tax=Calycina marina TaxID=1763456 RepID=A0A9P8CIF4_9HELO|nr:hypothetical protein BJ878DRAFT_560770 [Calycina marina]
MAAPDSVAELKPRRVILFGGQGSTSIFSSSAQLAAEKDVELHPSCALLLARYHAAFLEDLLSLDQKTLILLGIDTNQFKSPKALLVPHTDLHNHGVVQATTIYIYQTLHYLAEVLRSDLGFYSYSEQVIEAAGFCSGLIPAAVVAASWELEEYVKIATEGFRLAFWIAVRTSLHGREQAPVQSKSLTGTTRSLVVIGLTRDEVSEKMRALYKGDEPRIKISTLISQKTTSVSGSEQDLAEFKDFLGPDQRTKFAHVHAWYHGGVDLEYLVSQVLDDVKRCRVIIPSTHNLQKPLRSIFDGNLLDCDTELAPWIIRHLLVHCVDWVLTAEKLASMIHETIETNADILVKVLSFGPGSDYLIPKFEDAHPRIQVSDLSSFKSSKRQPEQYEQDGIAIVGIGNYLPKGETLEQMWETISQGLSAVSTIPETRFKLSDYYSADSEDARMMKTQHGAFLENPFAFDHSFFNISPREAKSMDPQQRVLLHTAQKALEDSGYVGDSSPSFQRSSMGCYIGLATGDYTDNLRNDIDVFYSPGTLRAFHSGRISYVYRLSGPSLVIDTACSGSAVSIYQACKALQNKDCDSALAGGVNVITSPDMYLGLARGHFLNTTGGCKTFDAGADGYCRAEGSCLFVLKRLSDAVAENDRIHGVIRDVVINQSGNASSITHPHSKTQVSLFEKLLNKTETDPATISVVEAHGTGTQAGDAREVASLQEVFGAHHSVNSPLIVSSIKGNIGHCEAASGAAGMLKLLLMLRHKQIPKQGGFHSLNPKLTNLETSGIVIPTTTHEWKHSGPLPRRAMLNNFGAAGSNAAALLEEYVEPTFENLEITERSSYVVNLSAKSTKALAATIQNHLELLKDKKSTVALKDIAYTATARRQVYEYQVSLACKSLDELISKLEAVDAQTVSRLEQQAQESKDVILVFSGQGAIYQGMAEELMNTSPEFKTMVEDSNQVVKKLGYPGFLSYFYKDQSRFEKLDTCDQIIASQCACFVMEYAMGKLILSWNIKPSYVMGHSLGEYAALAVAGAITFKEVLLIVATRANLMARKAVFEKSGMITCKLSQKDAEALIANHSEKFPDLGVSCQNSVEDSVIGGDLEQLMLFAETCKSENIKSKMLEVPYAFHSKFMDPILETLTDLGQKINWSTPSIPIISNVTGNLLENSNMKGDYFSLHARKTVRFNDGLETLKLEGLTDDSTIFLEIGPHPTTLPMIRGNIGSGSSYISALQKGKDAWETFSTALSQLASDKYPINWRKVFDGSGAKLTHLPGHPMTLTTFLTPYREYSANKVKDHEPVPVYKSTGFELLPYISTAEPEAGVWLFESRTSILGPLILGHQVGGTAICPASVFEEIVLEGAKHVFQPKAGSNILSVRDMGFANSLIYQPDDEEKRVSVRITRKEDKNVAEFSVSVQNSNNTSDILCCTGTVFLSDSKILMNRWVRESSLIQRQRKYLLDSGNVCVDRFSCKILYETIFTRVVAYAPPYQTLTSLHISRDTLEGIGSFKLGPDTRKYVCSPIFTDTLLHAAGFIANLVVKMEEVCICANIESCKILYESIDWTDTFTIYCSLVEIKGAILADSFVINSKGETVGIIRGMNFKKLRLVAFQGLLGRGVREHAKPKELPKIDIVPVDESMASTAVGTPVSENFSKLGMDVKVAEEVSETDIQKTLKKAVVEVSGFAEDELSWTKSLDELGIDSLMQIEIAGKLAKAFPGPKLDHNAFAHCETMESFSQTLKFTLEARNPPTTTAASEKKEPPQAGTQTITTRDNPVPIDASPAKGGPLFLVHDGSGLMDMYLPVQNNPSHRSAAFFDPFFGNPRNVGFKSVNEMAEHYVGLLPTSSAVLRHVVLGGWSFGGVVAFEMCRLLLSKDIKVKGLILIDSPYPIQHSPLPEAVVALITHGMKDEGPITKQKMMDEFARNSSMLGKYTPSEIDGDFGIPTVYLQCERTFDTVALCDTDYPFLASREYRDETVSLWEELVDGEIKVLSVPGNHFEPFTKKKVDKTAKRIQEAFEYVEKL